MTVYQAAAFVAVGIVIGMGVSVSADTMTTGVRHFEMAGRR